jgi:nicotinamide-nucleotide amidase
MVAEIISVGTELLLGQIVDTNAAYLSGQLSALGIAVYHRATVGDNRERGVATAKQALGRADFVFLIGGLGPTMDDLTRDIISEAMDAPLVRDESVARGLEAHFARRGYKMVDSNYRQAVAPCRTPTGPRQAS